MERVVKPGLNLLSKCITSTCEAYEQFIWIPRGFNKFRMDKEYKKSLCPMCNKVADKVNNFGVFSCFFSIIGVYKDENNKHISYLKKKTRAPDDQLLSFNENEGSVGEWFYLNIITEMIEAPIPQETEIKDASQTQNNKGEECFLF